MGLVLGGFGVVFDDGLEAGQGAGEDFLGGGGAGGGGGLECREGFFEEVDVGGAVVELAVEGVGEGGEVVAAEGDESAEAVVDARVEPQLEREIAQSVRSDSCALNDKGCAGAIFPIKRSTEFVVDDIFFHRAFVQG